MSIDLENRPLPWERPALMAGVVYAIGQIAATAYFLTVLAPHLPPLDAPQADQAAFYTDYAAQNALVAYLYLLPVPFFLVFLGGLFGVLRRLERGIGVLSAIALGAGLAFSMVWPIGIVVADSGQGMAQYGLQTAAVLAFDGIAQLTLALSAFPRAVLLLAASLALLPSGAIPRSVGWAGCALAVIGLVGTTTLLNPGIYPVLALGSLLADIWVGVVGGILMRRGATATVGRLEARASLAAS